MTRDGCRAIIVYVVLVILASFIYFGAIDYVIFGFMVLIPGVYYIRFLSRQLRMINKLINEGDILAKWTYTGYELEELREKELKSLKYLWYAVAVCLLVSLVVVFLFQQDVLLYVILVDSVLFAIFLNYITQRIEIRRNPGETIIARNGMLFLGQLTLWDKTSKVFTSYSILSAQLGSEEGEYSILVSYSSFSGKDTGNQTVLIPVPHNKKEEAETVIKRLNGSEPIEFGD